MEIDILLASSYNVKLQMLCMILKSVTSFRQYLCEQLINSLKISDTYICPWNKSLLFMINCCQISAKALSKQSLEYC